jgi:hypothetical protein
MTSADRVRLNDEVEAIRDELVALQERFADVMREVRTIPGGEWLYERVDAYPGIRLDRDMGAGQNAEDWISEVGAFLERGEDDAP